MTLYLLQYVIRLVGWGNHIISVSEPACDFTLQTHCWDLDNNQETVVPLQSIAVNGLSERVSVVHRDVGLLQRGREVRPLGANIAIADMFDAGKAVSQGHV